MTQLCPHLYKCSRAQATQGFAARTKTNMLDMLGIEQYIISSRRRFYVCHVFMAIHFVVRLHCEIVMEKVDYIKGYSS